MTKKWYRKLFKNHQDLWDVLSAQTSPLDFILGDEESDRAKHHKS